MKQVLHRCLLAENHSKREFPNFQCNQFLLLAAVLRLELKLGLGIGVIPSIEMHMHGPLSGGGGVSATPLQV